jgi:radical SAM protein with 4Fe4S-binding SPASM domain
MTRKLRHHLHWWRLRTEWYRKKIKLSLPPYFINIEPTGFCNLHCKVCSYRQDRGKGYIEPEIALRAMDQAAQFGVSEIRFFLAGEPLFHPRLGELIRAAGDRGLLTNIHTNATILDEKRARILLDSGLDTLSLSFDGETAEEYESVRIGADFEKTLKNVLTFLKLKKERSSKKPHVTLQVIKLYDKTKPKSLQLSPEFKAQFAGLPLDRFFVIFPFSWPGMDLTQEARPTGNKYFPCFVLWQSLSIAWDGRILGCCADLNGIVTLGDIRTDHLRDVWNGPAITDMRRLHVERQIRRIPLCSECDAVKVRIHPAIRDVKDLLLGRFNT